MSWLALASAIAVGAAVGRFLGDEATAATRRAYNGEGLRVFGLTVLAGRQGPIGYD